MQLGDSCLTYTSYARAFLASTHARFNKELDGETSNNDDFKKLSARLPWFTKFKK